MDRVWRAIVHGVTQSQIHNLVTIHICTSPKQTEQMPLATGLSGSGQGKCTLKGEVSLLKADRTM